MTSTFIIFQDSNPDKNRIISANIFAIFSATQINSIENKIGGKKELKFSTLEHRAEPSPWLNLGA